MQQLGGLGGGFGGGKGGGMGGLHPLLLSSLLGGGGCVEPIPKCHQPNEGTDLCGMVGKNKKKIKNKDGSDVLPCCECSGA